MRTRETESAGRTLVQTFATRQAKNLAGDWIFRADNNWMLETQAFSKLLPTPSDPVKIRAWNPASLRWMTKPKTHPQTRQNYYEALRKFQENGVAHEGAVRSAFQTVLEHCGRQFNGS